MKSLFLLSAIVAALGASVAATRHAAAASIAFLSNGKTCNGGAAAASSAVTPTFYVSLCLNTAVPWCGITYRFERIAAGGSVAGALNVKKRIAGVVTDFIADQAFPFTIPAPGVVNHHDLGATLAPNGALAPGKKILVATYNMSVLGSRPATDYAFRLADVSIVAVDLVGSCGKLKGGDGLDRFDPISLPDEVPIAATFMLRKQ